MLVHESNLDSVENTVGSASESARRVYVSLCSIRLSLVRAEYRIWPGLSVPNRTRGSRAVPGQTWAKGQVRLIEVVGCSIRFVNYFAQPGPSVQVTRGGDLLNFHPSPRARQQQLFLKLYYPTANVLYTIPLVTREGEIERELNHNTGSSSSHS